MEKMSNERWARLKNHLCGVSYFWHPGECAEVAAEMDRLREEVKALKKERDKWMTLADSHALTAAYLLGARKPPTPDPPVTSSN